mmetsp:Transcript_13179/g.52807  ORF Transcript_13179/g.52807 Transcript_13179/m.52807 type:complete len:221 (-) Transcript_13179:593-1255(-)
MRAMTRRVAGEVSHAPVHQAFSEVRPCETTFSCSPKASVRPWSVLRENEVETEATMASASSSDTKLSSVTTHGPVSGGAVALSPNTDELLLLNDPSGAEWTVTPRSAALLKATSRNRASKSPGSMAGRCVISSADRAQRSSGSRRWQLSQDLPHMVIIQPGDDEHSPRLARSGHVGDLSTHPGPANMSRALPLRTTTGRDGKILNRPSSSCVSASRHLFF